MRTRTHLIALALVTTLAAACGGSEEAPAAPAAPPPAPLAVSTVDLGTAIDAEKRVVQPMMTFAPTDTIYASVATTGTGSAATLVARWTFEDGQVVNETTQTVSPTGPAVHEFHISKETPWPAGKYKVEILLNGASTMTKDFSIGG